MADVSSATKFWPTAKEGFTSSTSGSVSSGAATVGLNSVSGYSNGEVVALVIDPTDTTKKQVFTGVVDTSGVQITGVVWTEGTNQAHSAGATVVDYETATAWALQAKGLLVEHTQGGLHTLTSSATITSSKVITGLNDTNGNELVKVTATGSAVNEVTLANAATGSNPTLSGTGGDTDIGINLTPKGAGRVVLGASGAPSAATVAASETTTSTSYAALATAQAVTATVGSSGLLWVTFGAGTCSNNTAAAICYMTIVLSGANTLAAGDASAVIHQDASANVARSKQRTILLTGLTAGSTVVTVNVKVATGGSGAGTGTWVNRHLAAIPVQ